MASAASTERSPPQRAGAATIARYCRVKQRRRSDPMSISAASDFHFGPAEETDAIEALRDPNITLYCLNHARREAIFVECDAQASATMADYPFYYQGQFEHARRAIIMGFDAFHAAADELGDRFERAVMIHSVGRCGSTLLSKMFGRLPSCLSLSEPDAQTNLIADPYSPDETTALLRSAARCYFQPTPGQQPTHLVLKFRSFCSELAEAMEAATPSALSVFLYRDIERVICSGMRVFRYGGAPLWWCDQLHRWIITRPVLGIGLAINRAIGTRLFPVLGRFTTWELTHMGPVGILAIAWLSAMERCVLLQRAGMRMPAIRYDDLIAHAEETTAWLADFCQLPPKSAPKMLAAMESDSQRGTILERHRQAGYQLTPRDRDTIAMVLARSEIIDSGEFELPRPQPPRSM